jgi:EthD domain
MIRIMALLKRKAGMSMDDFIDYYETRHALLGQTYLVNARAYRRHYLHPVAYPLSGEMADSVYDVITEVCYDTEEEYQQDMATLGSPGVSKIMAEDEDNLFDTTQNRTFMVETRESRLLA